MKDTALVLTSLVLLAAFAAPVQAQTLGDAARREAARRAGLKASTRVITGADLDTLPSRGGARVATPVLPGAVLAPAGSEAAAPGAGSADEAEPPVQATVREKRDEEHWRARAQVIRKRSNGLQADAAALEGRVEGLRGEIESAAGSQRTALTEELRQTAEMLTRVQGELRMIQAEWRQFEDRAVQAEIPPHWVR